MIKEIKYRGVTTTPSDYESTDGDLAIASGVIFDEGQMVTAKAPDVAYPAEGSFSHKPVFKHVTTEGDTHWICEDNNSFYNDDDTEPFYVCADSTQTYENIEAVGNTLIIMMSGSIHYVVYKDGTYKHLGDHIPTVEIQFGLNGKLKRDVTDNLVIGEYFNGAQEEDLTIKPGYEDAVTSRIMGEIELAMKKSGDDDDKFSAPFMVRYALKLYDGSYTNISAPVLMDNNFGTTPVVAFWAEGEPGKLKSFSVYNVYSSLTAEMTSGSPVLNGWEDIVKSIDVFVSRQYRNYNALEKVNSLIKYYGNYITSMGNSILSTAFSTNGWTGYRLSPPNPSGYIKNSFYNEYNNYFNDGTQDGTETRPRYQFGLPYYSNDELVGEQRGKIVQNSTFYKLYSFKLTTIGSGSGAHYGNEILDGPDIVVPVESGVIANIETQQSLTDDYYSNDKIKADTSYVYNSRFVLGDISRTPFAGFAPNTLNAPLNSQSLGHTANIKYAVLIDENDSKVKTETSAQSSIVLDSGNKYYGIVPSLYFYPNPNAKTLVVEVYIDGDVSTKKTKKIDLIPHPTLNGAYYISREPIDLTSSDVVDMSAYTDTSVSYHNQIYTSKPYNPYVFEASGVNEIGGGAEIKVLASNTQALSQGQFGQFPLYAFTSLGIWALELGKDGEFSSLSPVTRDIILGNGESLTQLDDSLVFATKRGIMELVGKNTKCISDVLDKGTQLPTLPDIQAALSEEEEPSGISLKDILPTCRMVYDYVNARIIVFSPEYKRAFVFSAKDNAWTIIPGYSLIDTINAYPDAYAVGHYLKGEIDKYLIYDLSTITDNDTYIDDGDTIEPHHEGWLITRPISLDDTNKFKVVDYVRQNGFFEEYLIKENAELPDPEPEGGYTITQIYNHDNGAYNGSSEKEVGEELPTPYTKIQQVLYGSNDLINWFVVASSNSRMINSMSSSPFKWFRLAVKTDFRFWESLSSVTFSYRVKTPNDKLQ